MFQCACVNFQYCMLLYLFEQLMTANDVFKTTAMSDMIHFNLIFHCISHLSTGVLLSLSIHYYILRHLSLVRYIVYIYYATLQEIAVSSRLFTSTRGERSTLPELCEKMHLLKKTDRAYSPWLR